MRFSLTGTLIHKAEFQDLPGNFRKNVIFNKNFTLNSVFLLQKITFFPNNVIISIKDFNMYRLIQEKLLAWKNNPYRKPLVIQGGRQVGKTYTVLNFGKEEYENIAYFNFQTNALISETFRENIEPSYLIPVLSRICGFPILKETTLIVFDEVQLCERALSSLKYFCEMAPRYHIIAAGSLLGIAVNRNENSFPVGKVDRLTMYPMNFEEFMIAAGEKELTQTIRNCFSTHSPLPAALHDAALNLYRKYLVIGGMPEAVSRFIETDNFYLVRQLQETILNDYLDDMSKYQKNASDISKTRLTYNTIAVQLSKTNTRFQYKLLKKGARASEFENAIEWLVLANIVSRIYRLDSMRKPLENNKDIDSFKIYLSDTGLLCAQEKITLDDILHDNQDLNNFKGGLTENYVNSQLQISGFCPYYYEEEGKAEIDFIIDRNGTIIPIEVKSSEHTVSKSLNYYMNKFSSTRGIRISTKNFGKEGNLESIPLYAVFCIQ